MPVDGLFFFFDCWQLVWLRGNGQSSCYASRTALQSVSELRLGSWPFRDVVGRCISGDVQYSIYCAVQFSRLLSAMGLSVTGERV